VLIGAMWIANLNYWGCNQYITQRRWARICHSTFWPALRFVFKIAMPVIVVLPASQLLSYIKMDFSIRR